MQLCEYENQNSGAFVVACSHLCAKFHCPVGKQNFSLLATVHESYWFVMIFRMRIAFRKTVVVVDWRFHYWAVVSLFTITYLSGSHLQSQVKLGFIAWNSGLLHFYASFITGRNQYQCKVGRNIRQILIAKWRSRLEWANKNGGQDSCCKRHQSGWRDPQAGNGNHKESSQCDKAGCWPLCCSHHPKTKFWQET